MSVNSTDPKTLFGGTWTQLKDRFLLGVGDTYKTVNTTGGEATHTLTVSEMPKHRHGYSGSAVCVTPSGYTWAIDAGGGVGLTYMNSMTDTGGDGSHNNMPPYLTVYMWKRTA